MFSSKICCFKFCFITTNYLSSNTIFFIASLPLFVTFHLISNGYGTVLFLIKKFSDLLILNFIPCCNKSPNSFSRKPFCLISQSNSKLYEIIIGYWSSINSSVLLNDKFNALASASSFLYFGKSLP